MGILKKDKKTGNIEQKNRPKAPAPPKSGVSRDGKRRFGCGGKIK